MTISEIRTEYTSAGDIVFRTAIGWLTEVGTNTAKSEKPDKLEMIEDYVKACAADIAESPEFRSRIADAFQTDKKMVYLVYYEDEETVKYVVGVYLTHKAAMRAYAGVRAQIKHDYDLDAMTVEQDDDSIYAWDYGYMHYVSACIYAKEVEE